MTKQTVLRYALAEFIDSGKLSVGYRFEDLTNALINLSEEDWYNIKDLLLTENYSSDNTPPPSDSPTPLEMIKKIITISVLTSLAAYFEAHVISISIGVGLVSGSLGFLYLTDKSHHNTTELNNEKNERAHLLLQHYLDSHPNLKLDVVNKNFLTDANKNQSLEKMKYAALQEIISDIELPNAFVDLQAFDRNIQQLANIASKNNKKIRLATKSLRIPDLIERALHLGGPQFCGLMCYSVKEAQFLFRKKKMDDLLIAYPTVQASDLKILKALHEDGATVSLVVDSVQHLELINKEMQGCSTPLPLVIDMDMSLRYLNGAIHLGVRRSPVRTLEDLRHILLSSKEYPHIKVIGVMGYEAGVAGLTDNNPYKSWLMNSAANAVRNLSFAHAKKIRSGVPRIFEELGMKLEIFNGGGSGSVNLSANDEALTEITAGSALLCPGFICDFSNIHFDPALLIALQVVRSSDPDFVTCGLGGGIIASGSTGPDRNLRLVSPQGLKTIDTEGFGEVQTPLAVKGKISPALGWPVFFRPAKGGESMEHFNQVHLIDKGEIISDAKTYRGVGLAPG